MIWKWIGQQDFNMLAWLKYLLWNRTGRWKGNRKGTDETSQNSIVLEKLRRGRSFILSFFQAPKLRSRSWCYDSITIFACRKADSILISSLAIIHTTHFVKSCFHLWFIISDNRYLFEIRWYSKVKHLRNEVGKSLRPK